MLDFNAIALFVQVVRSGSFVGAAQRLGMPANTVSRRVQELENELGARLLQRSTRRLTLTSAGEAFHERCAAAVDGLTDAGHELMTGSQEPTGLVRIAAPADFFDVFQMEWISEFLAAHPKVRLDFILSDDHADLIADRIDVAFRGGALQDLGHVAREVLANPGDTMVASPAYLAKRGTPTSIDELATHDFLAFAGPSGHATWQLAMPDGTTRELRITPRFSGNTVRALRNATLAGLGIALLPCAVTRVDIHAGLMMSVLPQHRRMGPGLNVLYPSRRHLPRAVSAFIELAVDKLRVWDQSFKTSYTEHTLDRSILNH